MHWNARGQALAAEGIGEYIRSMGSAEMLDPPRGESPSLLLGFDREHEVDLQSELPIGAVDRVRDVLIVAE